MTIARAFDFGDFRSVVPVVNRLVNQAHAWGIKTVFVAGSSAQPFAYLFKQLWQKKYKEPLPHFLALGHSPLMRNKWKKRLALFAQQNPNLKNMPSLVLDEYASDGETIAKVRDTVKKAGFTQAKTAILCSGKNNKTKTDFVGVRSKKVYLSQAERKAVEYIEIFAGQRSDIIEMIKERRNPKNKHAFENTLIEGKAFLRSLRAKSRAAAKRYKSRMR